MTSFVADANFLGMFPEDFPQNHDEEAMNVELFVELMVQFYGMGWMRGTGGAMGCVARDKLLISPSALQKERLKTVYPRNDHRTHCMHTDYLGTVACTNKQLKLDIFVYDLRSKQLVQRPLNSKVDVSSCSVLFSLIMKQTGSKCVVHTHGRSANLITQMVKTDMLEISHQEYIKGVYDPFTGKNLNYEDTLTIPIIENQPHEGQLLPALEECLKIHQRSCAVLVRNHGLFVWGSSWEKTKIMAECIDYLIDLAIEMTRQGISLVREDAVANPINPSEEYHHIFYSQ